jgi:hypothetical protein
MCPITVRRVLKAPGTNFPHPRGPIYPGPRAGSLTQGRAGSLLAALGDFLVGARVRRPTVALVQVPRWFMSRSASCGNLARHIDCTIVSTERRKAGTTRNMENDQTTTCVIEERRKRHRYQLTVPVVFSWRDARQAQHRRIGLTRDVSVNSAFVLTTTPPPSKAKIQLKVFFPRVVGAAAPMRLHGEGKVVHVEAVKRHDGHGGFAVVGKPFVLRGGGGYR